MNFKHKTKIPHVILASASKSRSQILGAVGITHQVIPANINEAKVKLDLIQNGADLLTIAETLAELKAQKISCLHTNSLVIGADQILDYEGEILNKPRNIDDAKAHLNKLSGRNHTILVSACVLLKGNVLWRYSDKANMEMRSLSDSYIDWYLSQTKDQVCETLGAYRLEGLGAQLFKSIEGDFFSILGLPLLPLLEELRIQGVLST
jgi:septum formation protein